MDLSANYEINVDAGTLTITKRALTITTATLSWDYDGQWHYGENLDMWHRLAQFDNLVSVDGVSELSLAYDKAEIIDYTPNGIDNDTKYQFVIADDTTESGYFHTTYCYDITYIYGRLYIEKVDLYITTSSPEKVYDGKPLTGDDENFLPEFVGLIEGELYEAYDIAKITDVGTESNTTQYNIYTYRDGSDEPTDTTINYVPHYSYGTLKVTSRPVKIVTLDASKEYDGEALTSDLWDYAATNEYELVEGHSLEAISNADITDVGEKLNVVVYQVIDENGSSDVNKNYTLVYDGYGKLTVTPRNILITTADGKWIYDAEEHSMPNYQKVVHTTNGVDDSDDALVLTHVLVADKATATTVIDYTPVKVTNFVSFTVMTGTDENAKDVTSNYSISYTEGDQAGKLEIFKRDIKIVTDSNSREYNGEAFSWTENVYIEEENGNRGLVNGFKAELDDTSITYVTYVHEASKEKPVKNELLYIIKDKDGNTKSAYGNDLNDNYEIDYNYGEIYITPHGITVTNPEKTHQYNGQYLCGDDKTIFDGWLLVEDYCEVDKVAKIIDFGVIDNDTTYIIRNSKGDDITSSYDITYDGNPTLSITAIGITVTVQSDTKKYDGTPLKGDAKAPECNGLIEGDWLVADELTVTEITDCGSTTNNTEYKVYAYRDGEETDISGNYEIDYPTRGTLEITPRYIIIATASDEKEFDGVPLTKPDGYSVTGDGLADGQELYVKDGDLFASITFITEENINADGSGSIPNEIDYSIRITGGKDVSLNYVITRYWNNDEGAEYGTLTITPRKISFTTPDDTFVYNGKAQWNSESENRYTNLKHIGGGNALISGHMLIAVSVTPLTNAGSIDNEIEYNVIDADNHDFTLNYDMDITWGTLTITKLDLYIALNTVDDFTYCNVPVSYPLIDGKLFTFIYDSNTVENETLVIGIKYQLDGKDVENPVNAGKYSVILDTAKIDGGNGKLSNYELHVTGTKFEISKREITVKLNEAGDKIYDAVAYEFPENNYEIISDTKLAAGDELAIAVKYRVDGTSEEIYVEGPIDAGSYIIEFDEELCIINEDYFATENYIINCNNTVSYIIKRRDIYFELKDNISYAYCGEVRSDISREEMMNFGANQTLQTSNWFDDLVVSAWSTDEPAVNVGNYVFTLDEVNVLRKNDSEGTVIDVTANYNIARPSDTTTLTIYKRTIEVSVWFGDGNSASHQYQKEGIDLNALYAPYGPYAATSADATDKYYWGIYPGDLDKVKAVFSFTKNGSPVEQIKNLGEYGIAVTLTDADGYGVFSRNYNVTSSSGDGTFTVIKREVNVFPTIKETQFEYDGKTLNQLNLLGYYTRHNGSATEEGIYPEDEVYYDAVYTLYDGKGKVVSLDSILQADTYTVTVSLTFNGMDEELYTVVDNDENEVSFTVTPRKIYVYTASDDMSYVYNRTAVADPVEYYTYYYKDGVWTFGGFVNDDEDFVKPVYSYVKNGAGSYLEAVDAGTYTIKIKSFVKKSDGITEDGNYEIRDLSDKDAPTGAPFTYGKLTIKPAILIVVPRPYSVKYEGQRTLELPANNYEIKFVEGNNGSTYLFGNDENATPVTLSFKVSDKVDITISNVTVVNFTDVRIYDNGKDITTNYDIIYSYEALQKKAEVLDKELVANLTPNKFMARLMLTQREVYVGQIAPPEDCKNVSHDKRNRIR